MKTSHFLFCIYLILAMNAIAFSQEPEINKNYLNEYYQSRMKHFENLPLENNGIVFLGNSITERGNWNELMPNKRIGNRGIGGDNTYGVLARLDNILKSQPKKIFIMIGINDLGRGLPIHVISNNYRNILLQIRENSPNTEIYIQSVLPLNDHILAADYLKNKKTIIQDLNSELKNIATEFKLPFIDLYANIFADGKGDLFPELTVDGIHLNPSAYKLWANYLINNKYIR